MMKRVSEQIVLREAPCIRNLSTAFILQQGLTRRSVDHTTT